MPTRWEGIASGAIKVPANTKLGIEIVTSQSPETVAFAWTVPHEYCNAEGNLQGGMLAAFADAALGGASALYLSPEEYPALAEMKISIYRPAPAGMRLTATGRVVKKGRRVMFVEADINNDDGTLIARATGTSLPAAVT